MKRLLQTMPTLTKLTPFYRVTPKFFYDDPNIKKEMTKQVKISRTKFKQIGINSDYKNLINECQLPFSEDYQLDILNTIGLGKDLVFMGGSGNITRHTILTSLMFKNQISSKGDAKRFYIICVRSLVNLGIRKTDQ